MSNRYNHWFWNSKPVDWFAQKMADFVSWLWNKQYRIRR